MEYSRVYFQLITSEYFIRNKKSSIEIFPISFHFLFKSSNMVTQKSQLEMCGISRVLLSFQAPNSCAQPKVNQLMFDTMYHMNI